MLRVDALRDLLAVAGMVCLIAACGDGSGDEAAAIETPSPGVGTSTTGPGADTGSGGGAASGGTEPGTGGDSNAGDEAGPSAPIAVPGTIEAEDFDRGGEAVGYHDKVLGNAGGQYRLDEDVDIVVSSDFIGGLYDVSDFETGEWLAYTIDVADTGDYDFAVRAAGGASDSVFRIEIDGRDVTESVTVPSTGSGDGYRWVGAARTGLTAGQHLLKVVVEQQYFELNSIRVTAVPVSSPYFGTPMVVPGAFEAEDFDLGGEGAGYHDIVAGNSGGQYRLQEDADIRASADAEGIYDIVDFASGEWLAYTINVASSGSYDVEARAATHPDFPGSAFRIEVDGRDVTGSVVLPDTGGWSNYQWLGQRTIALNAGVHQLKVVSERPYFALNSIRVSSPTTTPPPPPPPPPPPSSGATPLFKSGFEGATALGPLVMYSTGAWQDILGLDSETGFAWPPKLWGGTSSRFQLIAGDSEQVTAITLPGYMYNELQSVTGHDGTATRALFSTVQKSVGGALVNFDSTQNDFGIFPGAAGQGDLYLSYWLKFQPDLLQRMTVNSWAGRVVTDWKTGGDYRLILSVYGDRAGNRLYWNARGDNLANGGLPQQIFWEQSNFAVPVPVGQWFRVEVFVHRSSGADGRVWLAVNGQTIVDRYGSNMGVNSLPWNRIFAFLNYSSGQSLPAYQWVDDLEVWNGFPSTASPH